MASYLEIKSVSGSDASQVKQSLRFRTGKFVWRVFFNIALNPETVNNQNLIVFNSQSKAIDTKISYNSETMAIEIEPVEPYTQGEVYRLHVTNRVESRGGQHLKQEIDVEFAV